MNKITFGFFHTGRRSLAVMTVVILGFFAGPGTFAQSGTNRPALSNRWLLIVDTSRAMQSQAQVSAQLAARLVANGVQGQMHPGDTVGLWTFNDNLYSGEFPLQVWTPETAKTVGNRLFQFLQSQKYDKSSRLDRVFSPMEQVVKDSEFITVILFSDGSAPIRGTPFDAKINATYKEWRSPQKKNQMPFITLLRAKGGTITDYMVNTPPFPLELPPLPEELLKPKVVEPKIAEPVKARPVVVPPLILSGRKPPVTETQSVAQVSTPAQEPVAPVEPKPVTEPKPAAEPKPLAEAKPLVEPAPASDAKPVDQPAPVVVKPPVEISQPTPPASVPKDVPSPAAKPESAATTGAKSASPAPTSAIPVQSAVAVQPEAASGRKGLWIGAAALIVVLAVGAFLIVRRSRNASHASLITRSLDRDQK